MKQLLFCYKENRKLRVRNTIITDVFVPVQDVISPQKTTLTIPKTDKPKLGDVVVIRDNDDGTIEYIGYIDTITNKAITEIACYPLISVFDNDFVLDQMFEETTNEDGTKVDTAVNVVEWLTTQLTREFVNTDDDYQALPLIIRNNSPYPVFYKKALDTANLFEAYTDIFVNTGVYIVFSGLRYEGYYIDGIYCDIYCNTADKPIYLRYDNPQIQSVDIVDNTFTNYNKLIATQKQEEDENGNLIPATEDLQRYVFYLLDNNDITTNPKDDRRIKQVRSKAITFELQDFDEDEKEEIRTKFKNEGYAGDALNQKVEDEISRLQAQALLLEVYNELQASEYNLSITITMFKNDRIKLHKLVEFVAESDIIYTSRITKLEILNDKQIKVTLGALRNSLTDFKKKVEAI